VEHPYTLTGMANLADTYRNQGRSNEAEELEIQVMEMRKRVLSIEHPRHAGYRGGPGVNISGSR